MPGFPGEFIPALGGGNWVELGEVGRWGENRPRDERAALSG